jgi:hypothetical protein
MSDFFFFCPTTTSYFSVFPAQQNCIYIRNSCDYPYSWSEMATSTLISCNVAIDDHYTSLNGQCYESHNHTTTLLLGLNDLRKKGQLFDITLETGGKEFQVIPLTPFKIFDK